MKAGKSWKDVLVEAESLSTDQLIAWTVEQAHHKRVLLTTAFGMEGCALIDMFAAVHAPVQIVYLDTMYFFPETYALIDRIRCRYPQMTVVNRGTGLAPRDQDERYGPQLWSRDPQLCCKLRKLDPMREALRDADVWVTGLRRGQSGTRRNTPLVAWSEAHQVVKVNPLARWSRSDVWDYVRERDVPYNELHDRGYPSLGCVQCTSPVPGCQPHQYSRAGRWAGTGREECGLHSD